MSRQRRPLASARARDVLAQRVRASLPELFELIHAVNPTGRVDDPHPAERNARYELKARLQSLLVRDHGDELRVTVEADGSIALAHRYSDRDGCHAQLDALDDDARAWIRWQLDTSEPSAPPAARRDSIRSGPADREVTGGDALERGRQALAEYDFEAAVSRFREAFEDAGGIAAARALLEVLVESLAQDDEALALEAELDPTAREDGAIRGLLGLAAARTGDLDRARRWLPAASGAIAVESWVVVARTALERGAVSDAEDAARKIEQLDPAHPAHAELREAIVAARARARQPDEEALQVCVATGDDVAAELQARALLVRWPDSAIAGRTLAAIEQRRRKRAGDQQRAAAVDAWTRGDLARARELANGAATYGVDVGELVAEIDEALRQARATHDAASVAQVRETLREDEPRGFGKYLELDAELRAHVRRCEADPPALRWLEELGASKSRPAERRAAIDAIVALQAARAALAAGEHERVIELFDQHAALAQLRDACALRNRAREQLYTGQQRRAETSLDAAAAAWAARDLGGATRLLGDVDRRALPLARRRDAERLDVELRQRTALEARMQRIDSLVARRELLAARRELDALIADPEHDQRVARAWLADVRDGLRESWGVRSVRRSPFGPRELGELLGELAMSSGVEPWASQDGQLVLSGVYGCHVFIAVFEAGMDQAMIHHVETPAPLGQHAERAIDGERLWIASDRNLLQVDWRTGDVVRWESLEGFVGARVLENMFFMPGTLWIETRDRGTRPSFGVQIIDVDRWSVARTLNAGRHMIRVAGDEPMVAATGHDSGATYYAGRGSSQGALTELGGKRIDDMVCHPSGVGFVVATSTNEDDATVILYDVAPGHSRQAFPIAGSHPDSPRGMVAVRDHGVVVVHAVTTRGPEILGVRVEPAGLQEVFRVDAPYGIVLVHAPASRRAFVAWEANEGVHVTELGAQPPKFGASRKRSVLPTLGGYFMCHGGFLDSANWNDVDVLVREQRWVELRARLEAIAIDDVEAPHREHFHHLYGLACARTGDTPRAREIWQRGLAYASPERFMSCDLEACCAIVEELPAAGAGDDDEPPITRLRRAVEAASACRSRGDIPGAVATLRARGVARLRECQSLARLADAWLELPDGRDDAAWFDKAQALAQFLDAEHRQLCDLPLPDAWDRARLAEIAGRASAWFRRTQPRAPVEDAAGR